MFNQELKRIATHSLTYGAGNLMGRLASFFLLPLYTQELKPADYGVLGTLALLPPLLDGLFSLGFGVSMSRSYWEVSTQKEKDGVVWCAFLLLLINGGFWLTLSFWMQEPLSFLLMGSTEGGHWVFLTLVTTFFSALGRPFASQLQMESRSLLFAGVTFFQVLLQLALSVYWVLICQKGVGGVVLAGTVSQGLFFSLLLSRAWCCLEKRVELSCVRDLFVVGAPYILGLSGYFLMQYADRWMVQWQRGLPEVGLYFMGANFGMVLSLITGGFASAWPPFFNRFLKRQQEASHTFGKVLESYLFAVGWLVLGFFLFAPPLVRVLLHPDFYRAWHVVGITALSQMLWGMYLITLPGIVFAKKTWIQVLMECSAALLNLALNALLIPFWGMEGAAFSTCLSFGGLFFLSYRVSHAFLPLHLSGKKIALFSLGFVLVAGASFFPLSSLLSDLLSRLLLWGGGGVALWCWEGKSWREGIFSQRSVTA